MSATEQLTPKARIKELEDMNAELDAMADDFGDTLIDIGKLAKLASEQPALAMFLCGQILGLTTKVLEANGWATP